MAGMELLYVSAQSKIRNDGDAVVCAVHWNMINNGFKSIGLGEEPPPSKDGVKRSELLPTGWSEDPNAYSILYWPNNSTDTHVLKVIRLDNSLLIHLMRSSDNQVLDFSVDIPDYTTGDLSSFDSAYKDMDGLQKRFETEITKKLTKKSSAKASPSSSRREETQRPPQRDRYPDNDPLRVGPPRRGGQPVPDWIDPDNPLAVGRGDLDPLAGGRGGGMFMDPRGFPRMGHDPHTGIPGRLPPGAVPPGARFDPFGPPNPDALGGGNPRGPRAGPDPDHLPPPGYDDMFM